MPDLLSYLTATDACLSRTARSNEVKRGVHPEKKPALLHGDELAQAISRNRQRVAELLNWQRAGIPASGGEIGSLLDTLAYLTNMTITPGPLFRQWPYESPAILQPDTPPFVTVEDIADGLAVLADQCASTLARSGDAVRRQAAIAEWEIGIGPLHPYYDGCGRISRYFSTLLCLWKSAAVPRHDSREIYMAAARAGRATFVDYWLASPARTIDR